MALTHEILNSHKVAALKKEISKTNIKGYSKMKKNEIVALMMTHKTRFSHIKSAAAAPKKVAEAPKKKEEAAAFSKFERVSVDRYSKGTPIMGINDGLFGDGKYGKDNNATYVYIDKKSRKVFDSKKDFEKEEYSGDLITIGRGRGRKRIQGLKFWDKYGMLIFGKGQSYGYDYGYMEKLSTGYR